MYCCLRPGVLVSDLDALLVVVAATRGRQNYVIAALGASAVGVSRARDFPGNRIPLRAAEVKNAGPVASARGIHCHPSFEGCVSQDRNQAVGKVTVGGPPVQGIAPGEVEAGAGELGAIAAHDSVGPAHGIGEDRAI